MKSRHFDDDEEDLALQHWSRAVFTFFFLFPQSLSDKNDIGECVFGLEHSFQKGFLMAGLNAHSAVSRNINRHWRRILHLHREVVGTETFIELLLGVSEEQRLG